MRLGLHYWNYSTPSDPARMADTLADSMRTVRFRQDEKARLVAAADRIAAQRP